MSDESDFQSVVAAAKNSGLRDVQYRGLMWAERSIAEIDGLRWRVSVLEHEATCKEADIMAFYDIEVGRCEACHGFFMRNRSCKHCGNPSPHWDDHYKPPANVLKNEGLDNTSWQSPLHKLETVAEVESMNTGSCPACLEEMACISDLADEIVELKRNHHPCLHLLAERESGWRRFFGRRWKYSSEPFRGDIRRNLGHLQPTTQEKLP